jgi:tetratricopeptide (TPR) repeat protein
MQQKWKLPFLFVVLFLGVLLTYSNHFHNSFHFDDYHTIVNNAYIRDIHNIPRFFKDGTTFSSLPSNQSYRPLVSTTLAIDYALGGDKNMFWFHFSTFLLFLLQGVCMFFLIRTIFALTLPGTSVSVTALFTTAWYLLHPANAETINYIISRSDTLSTLFVVMAFMLYACSSFCRRYFLYLIPVALGTLAKPTAVMFGPMLAVYVFLFEESPGDEKLFARIRHLIVKTTPALLFCVGCYYFTRIMEPATWVPGGETSKMNYLITQPFVLFRYFYTFFLPVDLSADTDWKPFTSILDIKCIIGFIFLLFLLVSILLLSAKKIWKPVAFGLSWFFLALLPTSLTPLAEVMNDHRMFFPYVGLVISVSWTVFILLRQVSFLAPLRTHKDVLGIVCFLFLGAYAFGTHQRNVVWHDEERLWKDVTIKSPENGRGQMNYGLNLMQKGDYAGAEIYFKKGLALWPYYSYLHINMGVLKEAQGKPAEAEAYFKKALACDQALAKEKNSLNPECYFYYARFLKNQNRFPKAHDLLDQLFRISPGHLNGRYLQMEIYQQQGQSDKLKSAAQQTLQLSPNDPIAQNYLLHPAGNTNYLDALIIKAGNQPSPENYLELSLAYYNAGKYALCITASQEALKLKKDFAEAWNNIGACYGQQENWDEEIKACKEALRIRPDFELAKNNLNWALQHKK